MFDTLPQKAVNQIAALVHSKLPELRTFIELVTFARWPPRDQLDVRYNYIYIYIYFFRDSLTIDFIRWFASLVIRSENVPLHHCGARGMQKLDGECNNLYSVFSRGAKEARVPVSQYILTPRIFQPEGQYILSIN